MKKDPVMKMLEIMELHQTARILNESAETCLGFGMIPTCEDALAVGTSKVGGNPDLPSSVPWPTWNGKALDFLLQINLAEIPQNLRNELLPESGRFYFLYDRKSNTWGFDPQDRGSWKVLFVDGTEDELVRTGKPGAPGRASSPACRVEFYEALPPDWTSVRDHPELKNHPEEVRKFDTLVESLPRIPVHQIMGNPHGIQSTPEEMRRQCQLVSHGLYMGGGDGPPFDKAKAKELEPGAKDWRLLLQLDSDSDPGMEWGDRGRLYFWIREQDLKEKNFEDVWMILECF
ncbi:MAG: YwqG family protein [Desulfomonilaceae bacterium]